MNDTTTLHLRFHWRWIALALVLVIAVMVYLWQPWRATANRTISVRGEATIQATPDRFQFQPYYQGENDQKLTATGNAVVARLKELGVKAADLKTTTASAGVKPDIAASAALVPPDRYSAKSTFTITAVVYDQALAQKVADYLATTSAAGQITPTAGFREATRAKLELQARHQASTDAKRKAEAMTKQLDAKLGRVVKIVEEPSYGLYAPTARDTLAEGSSVAGPSVEVGTDEVGYAFTVTFELK